MKTNNSIQEDMNIVQAIGFIKHFRKLEKSTYEEFSYIINGIFKESKLVDNLMYKWKYTKKSFGAWYLNLGTENMIKLLHYFGIVDPQDEEYLKLLKEDEELMIYFEEAPETVKHYRSLVLFFCNTNILSLGQENFILKLPSGVKAFGRTANWGEFILSLTNSKEQEYVINLTKSFQ